MLLQLAPFGFHPGLHVFAFPEKNEKTLIGRAPDLHWGGDLNSGIRKKRGSIGPQGHKWPLYKKKPQSVYGWSIFGTYTSGFASIPHWGLLCRQPPIRKH